MAIVEARSPETHTKTLEEVTGAIQLGEPICSDIGALTIHDFELAVLGLDHYLTTDEGERTKCLFHSKDPDLRT